MLVSIFEWECSMIEYASYYKNNAIVSKMIIGVFWRIFVGLSAVDCCAQKLLVSFYNVLWNGVATLAGPSIQWTVNYVGWLLYVPTVTVFTFDIVCVSVNWCLILHIVWTRLLQTLGSPWILKSHSFTVFFHCCALQRKNCLLNLFGHSLWLTICNMSDLRKRYVGCQLFKIVHCCTRNNTVCRQHWAGSCWWLPSDCCCSLKPGNTLEEVWESPGKQAFGVCRTLYRVTRII